MNQRSDSTASPSKEAQLALAAANRAAEKLRKRKRALGQKLVVWENGNVVQVEP